MISAGRSGPNAYRAAVVLGLIVGSLFWSLGTSILDLYSRAGKLQHCLPADVA